ncbi:MAG: ATP-binding protein, partial [Chloroflexota bacterium]
LNIRHRMSSTPMTIAMTLAKEKAKEYKRQGDLTLELYYGPVFRISQADFSKIIEELLDNAFKFSETGTKVLLRSTQEGENFALHIRDYGRGMSGEQIKNLGTYMQFERTLYEQQGLGMGFTIAKRLVDLHGGRMKVKSDPQHGTLVQVSFPL